MQAGTTWKMATRGLAGMVLLAAATALCLPKAGANVVVAQTRLVIPGLAPLQSAQPVDVDRSGRHLLFYGPNGGGDTGLARYDRATSTKVAVQFGDEMSGDGRFVFTSARRVDLTTGAVFEPADVPFEPGVSYRGVGERSSHDGQVYVAQSATDGRTWLIDVNGRQSTPLDGSGAFVSSDGRWASYARACFGAPGCETGTFLYERATGTSTKIDDVAGGAALSQDGSVAVYTASTERPFEVRVHERSSGRSRSLASYFPGGLPPVGMLLDLAESGRRVFYEGTDGILRVADMVDRTVVEVSPPGPGFGAYASMSRDGGTVMYPDPAGGNAVIVVRLDGPTTPSVAAGETTVIQVAGRGGVPLDATAAVLNVTVTNPTSAGFVTVWPCNTERPTASSLNYTTGQTIPNAVITKLAPDGTACLYTLTATDLVIDVNGAFTTGGSFDAVTPARLLDSRAGQDDSTPNLTAGTITTVQIAGRGGVPLDATAAVLNVTVTNPTSAGFVTVWPCNTERPTASSLNYTTGQTIPNAVITKLAPDGTACLYTLTATDLVIDVNGAFTTGGSFDAVTPARLLDSRT